MPCAQFEDLLLDYEQLDPQQRRSIDAHVAACADCRAFLDSLADLDAACSDRFAQFRAPAGFREVVLRRIDREVPLRRPSYVPEVLYFVGWAAVVAIAVGLLYQTGILLQLTAALKY